MSFTIRIATRASQLALWQANHIADQIRTHTPQATVELVQVTTSGDQQQTQPLSGFGGTGAFTREVQFALLENRADLAVHSLKDLPTESVPNLCLASVPVRETPYDVLVLRTDAPPVKSIEEIPAGFRVGTGSPRRRAQLQFLRNDIEVSEIRGNVDTRLRKLDAGDYDAIVLAGAGIHRLGLGSRIGCWLQPPAMFPAVGQGALGLECRADDTQTRETLLQLNHAPTHWSVLAERSLLARLRAGCHAPVGVATRLDGDVLQLEGVVLSLSGDQRWDAAGQKRLSTLTAADDAAGLGASVAQSLIEQGAICTAS